MNRITQNGIVLFLSLILLGSCNEEFLEKYPLDALSKETFFNSSSDLQTFVNGLYDVMPRYDFQGGIFGSINYRDLNADIQIVERNITENLNRRSADGIAPLNSGTWNTGFNNIRRVNYFLENYDKVGARDAASNQYIGEGYFFRAWFYFDMLKNFGDIPLILEPLNVNDDRLYKARNSRTEVAWQIISDLDSAIVNLQWKGEGGATAGRINKEAAIVMKSRVALYEGTWEYYHGIEGTSFAVEGEDGVDFLKIVEPAVKKLIDHQGGILYENGGPLNEPYNQLFAIEDGHSAEGVFWYRIYTTDLLTNSHNFYGKASGIGGISITKRLMDLYLDVDGVPQSVSQKDLNSLNLMGQNLDPRFRQTVWTPDRGPLSQVPGRGEQGDESLRYPFISEGVDYFISTGLRTWKGAVLDVSQFRAGEQDDIFIRYAEALLAYAEAKAILGTITQADIDQTVNILRNRVGMNHMFLSEVQSWNIEYSASEGFDPSAANIVNEIRRERSVELALEGFRLDDLKRWSVFEEVINGYKPKGWYVQEFLDYFNSPEALANDGWGGTIDLTLIKGENVGTFADGTINPYFRSTQFQENGDGFWINKDRDYLNPVPTAEILLYEENGVRLTQNPGWK